jgi:hypothetical protein
MPENDPRTPEQIAEDLAMANEFASPGTVKHFALRLGFMPYDEAQAEAILTSVIREGEECCTQLEFLIQSKD